MKPFAGRKLLVATQHGKERVMAPLLERALGVSVSVPEGFNTDAFGTFSGEVERTGSPLEAAREKCQTAFRETGISLIAASEGSFGPHPFIGFIPADEELILLTDFEHHREYKAKVISTATNFSGRRCLDWESVSSFARECHFPEHGLILRSEKSGTDFLKKGLQDWGSLQEFTRTCLEQFGCCYVETDMRAQYNPMRMQVIQEATQKLVTIIGTPCPACAAPGFEVVALEPGLPCSACGRPTKSTRSIRYACQSCLYQEKRKHPQGKNLEDPMYCDHCNP